MSLTSLDASAVDTTALNERLIEILKDAVGRSTSARSLSDKLGKSHNYVRRLFSGEIPLQVSTLFDMLQKLSMPPRTFFDQVLEGLEAFDPIHVLHFYREGDGLPRDPFLDEIGPRIAALARRQVDSDAAVESHRNRLDGLEEQRFGDREGAKIALERLVREIVGQAESLEGAVPSRYFADLARACAIWAVIQRISGYRDNSSDMYEHVFECVARVDQHPRSAAECYQKAAYLLRDLTAVEAGLQFLRIAGDLYLSAGDIESVGKILVDKGLFYSTLQDVSSATREYQASLKLLTSNSVRHRAAAFEGLARNHEAEGNLMAAYDNIKAACSLYTERVDIVVAHLLVTRGRVAQRLDLISEAEDCLTSAMNMFEQVGQPGDVLLAALDYAGLLLVTGQTRKLSALADEMFALAKYFRKNRIIDAALMEFVRMAKWGDLTEDLLKETMRRMEVAKTVVAKASS